MCKKDVLVPKEEIPVYKSIKVECPCDECINRLWCFKDKARKLKCPAYLDYQRVKRVLFQRYGR